MEHPHALPGELTIYTVTRNAGDLGAWLREAAQGDGPRELALDATTVAEIDSAGVQLLAALARGCREQSVTLSLQGASAPLAQACAMAGLDHATLRRLAGPGQPQEAEAGEAA